MAVGYRDINTAKTVVRTLQTWPAKAGGCSPKGPAVAGTTVPPCHISTATSAKIVSAKFDFVHQHDASPLKN